MSHLDAIPGLLRYFCLLSPGSLSRELGLSRRTAFFLASSDGWLMPNLHPRSHQPVGGPRHVEESFAPHIRAHTSLWVPYNSLPTVQPLSCVDKNDHFPFMSRSCRLITLSERRPGARRRRVERKRANTSPVHPNLSSTDLKGSNTSRRILQTLHSPRHAVTSHMDTHTLLLPGSTCPVPFCTSI